MNAGGRALLVGAAAILAVSVTAAGDETGGRPPSAERPASPPAPAYSLFPSAVAGEEPVPLPADLPDGWYARIDTSMGAIVARLLPDQAPQSVAHFAALAEGRLGWPDPVTGEMRHEPYYDGLIVTRARASERVELGERTEIGRSAPPFFVRAEGTGPVDFSAPGRLGMIRSTMNRISGVKLTITAGSTPYLNGLFPCFGTVVSGLDVVQRMSEVKTRSNGMPLEPLTIRKVRIRKVGNPAPLADPVPHTPKAVAFGLGPAPR